MGSSSISATPNHPNRLKRL